jgi:hypothetical protein
MDAAEAALTEFADSALGKKYPGGGPRRDPVGLEYTIVVMTCVIT